MSTSQMPSRRRSGRLAEEEDNGPPAKKSKLDESSMASAKAANGRKKAPAAKKTKLAYEEDVDGFNFSRGKAKKPPAATTNQSSSSQPLPTSAHEEARLPPPKQDLAPTKKRKKTSLEAKDGEPLPKRRSARLSGESQPQENSAQDSQPSTGDAPEQAVEKAKVPKGGEIRVEKKRGTKIALPFADTPIINRNREMRQSSGQNLRRSSGSMRGRRASSLIESGTSNAVPHNEVATADFYKHISPELLETRRMKQLLTWCATRALPERTAGTSEDMNAILAARHIEEELLKDFSNKSEMSDWFDRQVETAPTVLVKKPNPRNQQNAAKLQELRKEKERLEKEKSSWSTLLGSFSNSMQHNPPTTDLSSSIPLDSSALVDPEQQRILQNLAAQPQTTDSAQVRLKKVTEALEYKIDTLGEGTHKMERFRETVDAVVDQVQRNAAETLNSREEDALKKTGTENVGVRDILKALSRTKQ